MSSYSKTVRAMIEYLEPVIAFLGDETVAARASRPEASDLQVGNPHEMPLPEIQRALTRWAAPQNNDWFAYKFNVPSAIRVAVESLRKHTGIDFDPLDISMTTGAFGGLASTLRAVLDPGDQVIYLSPPWFFYVPMILSNGARPVRVDFEPPKFELPVDAIGRAITDRTRAIIVNTPHNPSGRVMSPDELERLAAVLNRAPQPIYLISDESYNRILYDGREHHSPLRFYDRSFLIYTYGKTLLAPGQRVGYIAMAPAMPDREELRTALFTAQAVTGYAFPNAVMQYALGDLEKASVDVAALQRRRDRIVSALTEMGYEDVVTPEGTFYVVVRSPIPDDTEFTKRLREYEVFVLPGQLFELPGWFRISLTANDGMIERSLVGFESAMADVTAGKPK